MLTKLEIFLLAAFFSISTALFAAAIMLAVLHHYRRIPCTYINQYNAHPTINYVLPQQPPPARIRSPIHDNGSSEIHELSSICCKQTTEDMASTDKPVPENRTNTHPRTPVILLSSTSSSSAASSKSTPYVVNLPHLSHRQTLPSDFVDSRWSKEVLQGPPHPTHTTFPATILGMSPQQNPLLLTQMTSGTLLHPVPFYPSLPSYHPGSNVTKTLTTQPSSIGTSPYQPLSQIQSQPLSIPAGEQSKHQSLGPPEHQPLGSNSPKGSGSSQQARDPLNDGSLSPTVQKSEGDPVTGGQAKTDLLPQLSPRDSLKIITLTEQVENQPMEPPSHHDTPLPGQAVRLDQTPMDNKHKCLT